jgi:hypothetical protein
LKISEKNLQHYGKKVTFHPSNPPYMTETTQLEDFKAHLESLLTGSVPINTTFKTDIAIALIQYAKDKGLNHPQDVIRLSVASFLSKAGYLNK